MSRFTRLGYAGPIIGIGFLAALLAAASVWGLWAARLLPGSDAESSGAYVERIDLPEPTMGLELPEIAGPDDPTAPLVVLDAGHGGHDPGATGQGVVEKDLVLQLALALRDRLLEQGTIRVALTRESDRFLALSERVAVARELDAALFLSIHADSAGDEQDVRGATIYTLSSKATSEAAARFAARENQADFINGRPISGADDEVNDILVELSQRRSSEASAQFADLILREGEGILRFNPKPRRAAGLAVLRAPDVPSVLFESGFITNPREAQLLASPEGQAAFAEAMTQAIRVFFVRNGNSGA